jgi:hypothetical protein
MNYALTSANVMATFDAVYSATPMSQPRNMGRETDESISDVDVVANVIKGALGPGCAPRA